MTPRHLPPHYQPGETVYFHNQTGDEETRGPHTTIVTTTVQSATSYPDGVVVYHLAGWTGRFRQSDLYPSWPEAVKALKGNQ